MVARRPASKRVARAATKKVAKKATRKATKKATRKATKKVKKTKRVSKIASGKLAKSAVFKGRKEKTVGGLKASDLIKSKTGKIVSKKQSMSAKKNFAKRLGGWNKAVMAARKALGVKGFCAVGGKSAQGKALLACGSRTCRR